MKTLIVVAGLMIEEGSALVSQRRENSPQGGLWEFPGGKVMEGEEPREALRRELKEKRKKPADWSSATRSTKNSGTEE